jgi:hypothetical protein
MTRYYFDCWDGSTVHSDHDGTVFDHIETARQGAEIALLDFARTKAEGRTNKLFVMFLRTDSDAAVGRLALSITITGEAKSSFVPHLGPPH